MLKRAALILLVGYTILSGATFDGILSPQRRLLDAALVGGLTLLWLVARRRWRWNRTPLDWAILIWCAAFALSLIANLDSWRRIAVGLWFVGVYIGVWYVLQDALANHALRHEWLVDALLIAGVPIVFIGYAQVELALTSGLPLPRPVSTLGNANALAGFLVMLLPFTIGRFSAARSPLTRVLLGFYGVGAGVLLVLTFSRGGWIGGAAGLIVWCVLRLPVRQIWEDLPRLGRAAVVLTGVVSVLVMAYVLVQSFGMGGRGLDLRTWIYETALQRFAQRPLTGYGLFTFGAGLSSLNSLPPFEPHSHAHNLILNVAAELGVLGLAALAVTAWLVLRTIRRPTDATVIMGAASLAGFAAHQMLDMPVMMPALALVALLALVLTLPTSVQALHGRWQPVLLATGGLALAGFGIWNALNYSTYTRILSESIDSGDYRSGAERLQSLADADPMWAIYPQQQGLLLGFAAAEGDTEAARDAIEKFRLYTRLAPEYASGWANLSALYESVGERTPAEDTMRHAADLAPQSWALVYRLGVDAEAAGDRAAAQQAYQQAYALLPDIVLLPEWNQSPLRQGIQSDESQFSPFAQALLALERDDVQGAHRVWDSSSARTGVSSNNYVMNMLFSLIDRNLSLAQLEWQSARNTVIDFNARVWLAFGAAFLDSSQFDQHIASARAALEGTPFSNDWELGANVDYIQYLTLALPRQFLPQVGYTEADPVLLYYLGSPDALGALRTTILGG